MSTHAPAIKCPVKLLTLGQLGWPRTHIIYVLLLQVQQGVVSAD